MKKNLHHGLILFFLFSGVKATSQTNLIDNGDFEEKGTGVSSNKPNDLSQLQKSKNWRNFNTSDWYRAKNNFFQGHFATQTHHKGTESHLPLMTTANGSEHYAGFGPCEGMQIKLNSVTEKFTLVKIGFSWSPRAFENTLIRSYLLTEEAASFSDCSDPGITFEPGGEFIENVVTEGATPIHVPGQWERLNSPWQLITENSYEWFAIKGDNKSGTLSSKSYLYIDDVEVLNIPFCEHFCAPNLGDITYENNPLPTSSAVGNNPFHFVVENALGIEFRVYSDFGGVGNTPGFYNFEMFDPNGLEDTGFNNFLFWWDGFNDQGNIVQQDVYVYYLKMWNCKSTIEIINTVDVIHDNLNNAQLRTYTPSQFDANCREQRPLSCPMIDVITDPLPNGTGLIEQAADLLLVQGNSSIPVGSEYEFQADNRVVLATKFHAPKGSKLRVSNDPCVASSGKWNNQSFPYNPRPDIFSNKKDLSSKKASQDSLLKLMKNRIHIYPNPSSGHFTLIIPSYENSLHTPQVTVLDIMGRTMYQKITKDTQLELDLSSQAKGVYFVKVQTGEQLLVEKLVLQ